MGGRELFEHVKALCLPPGDHVVFGSGPLLVRGWIDHVNDLDVLCRPSIWDLVEALGAERATDQGVEVLRLHGGLLSFGTTWALGDIDVDVVIDCAEDFDGFPFALLEHVVAYKRAAGRPKDLAHLEIIRRHAS